MQCKGDGKGESGRESADEDERGKSRHEKGINSLDSGVMSTQSGHI